MHDHLPIHPYFRLEVQQVARQAGRQFAGLDRRAVGVRFGQVAVDEVGVGLGGGNKAERDLFAGEADGVLAQAGQLATAHGVVGGIVIEGGAVFPAQAIRQAVHPASHRQRLVRQRSQQDGIVFLDDGFAAEDIAYRGIGLGGVDVAFDLGLVGRINQTRQSRAA